MYDWDPEKSRLNQQKHGISFEKARDFIFEGENLLAPEVAYEQNEVRHAVIGRYQGRFYTGIFTFRENAVRIISVRRARNEEKKQAKAKGL